jgi:hypothetical protein
MIKGGKGADKGKGKASDPTGTSLVKNLDTIIQNFLLINLQIQMSLDFLKFLVFL